MIGYEVVLVRHGETLGYDGDLGLTALGEHQARERGTALAKEIAPGTDVRMPHAQTARAAATAVALRAALVDALGGEEVDGTTVGPLYAEPHLANLRFALDGNIVDTSVAVTARLALADGETPDWVREYDRFDSDYRTVAALGAPIEYWLHQPTLFFEPPQLAAHRVWRGVVGFGAAATGDRPLLVVGTTHSAAMRAFVATALGRDAGEPRNLEDVRVRVAEDGSVDLTFRDDTVSMTAPPALPPWFCT